MQQHKAEAKKYGDFWHVVLEWTWKASFSLSHRLGNRQETIVADEDDVEDWRSTQQVIHDQPQLTQSPT